MSMQISSPVTGSAQADLTSPTYTLVDDVAPESNQLQYAVSALGGTQTGVDTSSVSKPFTVTVSKPKTIRVLGPVNPVTGALRSVPVNVYKVITRKGVDVLAGQPASIARVETLVYVPAGSDLADHVNLQAMASLHIGALSQISSELGDTMLEGTL